MITREEYTEAIATAGIELRQHEDPRRGWCWRIRDLTDWYEPEATEARALTLALVWLAKMARHMIEQERTEGGGSLSA